MVEWRFGNRPPRIVCVCLSGLTTFWIQLKLNWIELSGLFDGLQKTNTSDLMKQPGKVCLDSRCSVLSLGIAEDGKQTFDTPEQTQIFDKEKFQVDMEFSDGT